MFRGERPQGQPRSLRVIAEEGNDASSFEGAVPYIPQVGLPADARSAQQTYHDAVTAERMAQRPVVVPSVKPFTVSG